MNITEKLMQANGIDTIKRKPDSERIKDLEAENESLKTQISEQADALVELAEIITSGE